MPADSANWKAISPHSVFTVMPGIVAGRLALAGLSAVPTSTATCTSGTSETPAASSTGARFAICPTRERLRIMW